MSQTTLETVARMTDSKIQIKQVVDKFILLTYDLPATEAGDKARFEFFKQAQEIGAQMFTESCYLLPCSKEAEKLALLMAKTEGGEVIVWTQAEPLNYKEEITRRYDAALKKNIVEISGRLDKMDIYYRKYRGRCIKMIPKTQRLLDNTETAVIRRGSEQLLILLELLKQRFARFLNP
jgi:hypothetical protein